MIPVAQPCRGPLKRAARPAPRNRTAGPTLQIAQRLPANDALTSLCVAFRTFPAPDGPIKRTHGQSCLRQEFKASAQRQTGSSSASSPRAAGRCPCEKPMARRQQLSHDAGDRFRSGRQLQAPRARDEQSRSRHRRRQRYRRRSLLNGRAAHICEAEAGTVTPSRTPCYCGNDSVSAVLKSPGFGRNLSWPFVRRGRGIFASRR